GDPVDGQVDLHGSSTPSHVPAAHTGQERADHPGDLRPQLQGSVAAQAVLDLADVVGLLLGALFESGELGEYLVVELLIGHGCLPISAGTRIVGENDCPCGPAALCVPLSRECSVV